MGAYLIPAARSVAEVCEYAMPTGILEVRNDGILVTDATRTDAELASLYAGFVPTATSEEAFRPRLADAIRVHADYLRALYDAIRAGQTPTNAQVLHVIEPVRSRCTELARLCREAA